MTARTATPPPYADELCDGVDQDCDDAVGEDAIDPATWHADLDGDGHGDPAMPPQGGVLPGGAAFTVLRGLQRSARGPPGERFDAAEPRGRGLNPEHPHGLTRAAASLRLGPRGCRTDGSEVTSHADLELIRTCSAERETPMRACRAWAMLWAGASFLLSSYRQVQLRRSVSQVKSPALAAL
jgi:hypothetical protein